MYLRRCHPLVLANLVITIIDIGFFFAITPLKFILFLFFSTFVITMNRSVLADVVVDSSSSIDVLDVLLLLRC